MAEADNENKFLEDEKARACEKEVQRATDNEKETQNPPFFSEAFCLAEEGRKVIPFSLIVCVVRDESPPARQLILFPINLRI